MACQCVLGFDRSERCRRSRRFDCSFTLGKRSRSRFPRSSHRNPPRLARGPPSDFWGLKTAATFFNSAGIIHVRRTRDWDRVNTEGSRNLLEEALDAKSVRRFVYISSNAAAGKSRPPSERFRKPTSLDHERLWQKQAASREDRSLVFGPDGDRRSPALHVYGPPTPVRHLEVYRRILRGRMRSSAQGNTQEVSLTIQNLVAACRSALRAPGISGQTYSSLIAAPTRFAEIIEAMGGALGVPVRYLRPAPRREPSGLSSRPSLKPRRDVLQNLHLWARPTGTSESRSTKPCAIFGYDRSSSSRGGMRDAIEWCRRGGASLGLGTRRCRGVGCFGAHPVLVRIRVVPACVRVFTPSFVSSARGWGRGGAGLGALGTLSS